MVYFPNQGLILSLFYNQDSFKIFQIDKSHNHASSLFRKHLFSKRKRTILNFC
jgi:hypothetical protein